MKSLTNEELSTLLSHVASAYSMIDDRKYRFQILAYQKAADSILNLAVEVKDLMSEDALDEIPGVGQSIRNHILELYKTGEVSHFKTILGKIPAAVFPLLDIPTFGPKKAYKLVKAFDLKSPKSVIQDVYKLANDGKIAPLDSFGEKSQNDIKRAIDEYRLGKTKSSRMVLQMATEIANNMLDYLKKEKSVLAAYPLGSLRRRKSTVGDVDIAVVSDDTQKVLDHFTKYPHKDRIIERGEITSSIILSGNKQVDLMVLQPHQLGSLLQHFTGSKEHNIHLREYAIKKGYSLSEKGIKLKNGDTKTFDKEEEFYNFLGLDFIPPEIRENNGEIEAALNHKLPELIEFGDIKGDLHVHSDFPIEPSHDLGQSSFELHLKKAKELNYEYLGFSEHNPSVGNHNEEEICTLISHRNERLDDIKSKFGIHIIKLLEVDILASGKLALGDKCMNLLDMAIVSIHSSFRTEKKEMTERILSGLSHPKAKILAHPTGRLINMRPGYEANWERIFEFCARNNKALEINSWPTRLDLRDDLVRIARDKGCKFVINSDSHDVAHMDNIPYGVSVARRGWLEKDDVINTYSYTKLLEWIKK